MKTEPSTICRESVNALVATGVFAAAVPGNQLSLNRLGDLLQAHWHHGQAAHCDFSSVLLFRLLFTLFAIIACVLYVSVPIETSSDLGIRAKRF